MNRLNQYAARGCNTRKAQLPPSSSIAVAIVIMAEHQQQPFHHVHHHSFYVLNKTGKSRRFTKHLPLPQHLHLLVALPCVQITPPIVIVNQHHCRHERGGNRDQALSASRLTPTAQAAGPAAPPCCPTSACVVNPFTNT